DNAISPPLKLGVVDIKKKMWFHTLVYGGQCLSRKHIDAVFYYLRKKVKYDDGITMRVTSTDSQFDLNLQSLYKLYVKKDYDTSVVNMEHVVAEYMSGYKMHCNTCWLNVDHVLIPIYMEEEKHWVLGHLSLRDRCMYIIHYIVKILMKELRKHWNRFVYCCHIFSP
ncbi:Ulp1 protease family, C-terminal catalytic domain containing protein, partial [Trema orientale]